MKQESREHFKKVEQPSDVVVNQTVAWEMWDSRDNDSVLYFAKVINVTPKTIIAECKDAGHKYLKMNFRMRSIYGGKSSPETLEPYGDATGTLYLMDGDLATAIVQAAYDARAAAKAKEDEAKAAKERERQEYIAQQRIQAAADNPGVEFTQFTALGNAAYYHGFVRNAQGHVVLLVVAVARVENDSWKDDEIKAHPFIWKAAVNYDDAGRSQEYGPNSMGSISDVKANTLDEMFQEVIYRAWR